METTTIDAKPTELESSPISSTPVADPSPAPVTSREAVHAALGDDLEKPETSETPSVETDTPQSLETEKPAEVPEQASETPKVETKVEDYSDVPFNKHPRFQELIQERKQLKEELAPVKDRLQQAEAILQAPQVRAAIDWLQLMQTDPQRALTELTPIVDALKSQTGEALSPDLQKDVDEGNLTLAHAKRIAKAEADARRVDQQRQNAQQHSVQQSEVAVKSAWASWEQQHQQSDPDYATKRSLIEQALTASVYQQGFPQTVADAIKRVEECYATVNETTKKFQPKIVPRRSLSSGTATTTITAPDFSKMSARELVHWKISHGQLET